MRDIPPDVCEASAKYKCPSEAGGHSRVEEIHPEHSILRGPEKVKYMREIDNSRVSAIKDWAPGKCAKKNIC